MCKTSFNILGIVTDPIEKICSNLLTHSTAAMICTVGKEEVFLILILQRKMLNLTL